MAVLGETVVGKAMPIKVFFRCIFFLDHQHILLPLSNFPLL
jgi:hypothetical protein